MHSYQFVQMLCMYIQNNIIHSYINYNYYAIVCFIPHLHQSDIIRAYILELDVLMTLENSVAIIVYYLQL